LFIVIYAARTDSQRFHGGWGLGKAQGGKKRKRRLIVRVVVEGTEHMGGHVFGKVPRVKEIP
jgi:hypothetical protein